ncbi:MAG: acetyl-CoA carboxylase carboxyltransferase subunit beta [Nitrospinae bacterium]|nr:acetyl-CoA carboxylase carboxyltransferase subunit beta [Nitrospinota bacterium]
MSWFTKVKTPLSRIAGKRGVPEGVWRKCAQCKQIVYNNELESNQQVCPQCNHHHRLSARDRIETLMDTGSFAESDAGLVTVDPLKFRDQKKYKDRVAASQKKTGLKDAIVAGSGRMNGVPVEIAALDFGFQGGSMGSVVGEKLTRTFERGVAHRRGVVTISCSGGARMQEGILSLMQMAKTSAAVAELGEARLPFISVLADPTTGGVTASYAMLGDVIIAEPGALICFAGPRVIEQTIKQTLPDGFQRAEFLLEHGFVDMVVHRHQLKDTLSSLLSYMTNAPVAPTERQEGEE